MIRDARTVVDAVIGEAIGLGIAAPSARRENGSRWPNWGDVR